MSSPGRDLDYELAVACRPIYTPAQEQAAVTRLRAAEHERLALVRTGSRETIDVLEVIIAEYELNLRVYRDRQQGPRREIRAHGKGA